jgi:hypothetical protein
MVTILGRILQRNRTNTKRKEGVGRGRWMGRGRERERRRGREGEREGEMAEKSHDLTFAAGDTGESRHGVLV